MSPIRSECTTRLDMIVESLGNVAQKKDAAELPVLGFDAGVQALRIDTPPTQYQFTETPRTQPVDSRELTFESLTVDGRAALLMQSPPGLRVRVNGSPAGRLRVLNAGDELQLDAAVLHLVEYDPFFAGPPADEYIGRPCGLCRTPIIVGTRIYVHGCGTPLHIEDESTPADQRLECALVTDTCPVCERNISLQTGYRDFPEL